MEALAPELADLLRAGAADDLGICCRPSQVTKLYPALREAERLGYVRFLDIERPWITDSGRAAIGAPPQLDADYAKLTELCRRRKSLVPARKDDPRTDFDYRSYKAMGYVCTLAVRQPDAREKPATLRVGRTLQSDPQFLGPRNAIILPESEGTRFALAVMPKWLIERAGFSTWPMALPDDEPWTEDERATWDRLRQVCHSVNSRIRTGGRRSPTAKLHYGEFA